MILELKGTKVTIVDKTLGYQGDNLVNTIQVTVDTDSTWNYKLDMYKGKSKCFDPVLMTREGNVCTVQLTNEILSYGGRYIFQLRGYTDTQTYHSDIFESWVNTSIEYQYDCKQGDCECDCKLPTEFYQIENNITEINNHPPYPGDNNKWMIWDVDRHEYVESDIEVVGGGGGDYQTKSNLTTSLTPESTNEQYPSAKATYEYGQSIAESAGKINAITVNGTVQTVEDKTAKIIVNKSTVGLGNVDNTSDKDKPISTAQATAIADAKKAGTDAQANLTAHINDKENPHEVTKAQVGLGDVDNTSDVNKPISTATQTALNGKLDKTAVVDVTVEATKGQAADAKSVYDAIQALPTGTDISLGVTGAAVGDIIKVKAVDASGKPTSWEAAEAKLANPNALTFTGAVTGSYDGSAPLSVEIPSGGGGGDSGWEYLGEFTVDTQPTFEIGKYNLFYVTGYATLDAANTNAYLRPSIDGTRHFPWTIAFNNASKKFFGLFAPNFSIAYYTNGSEYPDGLTRGNSTLSITNSDDLSKGTAYITLSGGGTGTANLVEYKMKIFGKP